MHNFKNLKVWQKSRVLVKDIYLLSNNFPDSEKFGLTSQIRRATVSIPSNIAEGSGRGSNKEFAQFLGYALSSAYEIETQLILSLDLEFISEKELKNANQRITEIQKMLFTLIKKFKN